MEKAEIPAGASTADPVIASYVALIRQLAVRLACAEEPAQFLRVLEQGAKADA
jgi:hypothetical protein